MKYVMSIEGNKVILTAQQLEAIIDIIDLSPTIEDHYVGNKMGDDGGNYKIRIGQLLADTKLTVRTMSSSRYDALVLKTKLEKEPS